MNRFVLFLVCLLSAAISVDCESKSCWPDRTPWQEREGWMMKNVRTKGNCAMIQHQFYGSELMKASVVCPTFIHDTKANREILGVSAFFRWFTPYTYDERFSHWGSGPLAHCYLIDAIYLYVSNTY